MPVEQLGRFRIHAVSQGTYWWDAGAVFGVVPKTLWSRHAVCDEWNRVPMSFTCCVIDAGETRVLVETGAGDKVDDLGRRRMNLSAPLPALRDVLSQASIDPDSIDIVINTHLHWDHCGGNTLVTEGGVRAAFPRARYFTRAGELRHARSRHPRDRVSYHPDNYETLIASGQMTLLDEDAEIVPGIRVHCVPGHNRDMMLVTAESAGEQFVFFSDLVPTAAHITPTWVAAFDLYPLESIDNKTVWLSRAARENWLCAFGHDPASPLFRVRQKDEKFYVESCSVPE